MQFGCNFTDTTTSTDYNGQKAVWFPTVQGIANSSNPTQTDVLSCETIPDNAPYVNLKAWASCPNGVLNWLGQPFFSPTPPLYLTETEVQARIDTAMRSGSLYTDNTRDIAIAALVLSLVSWVLSLAPLLVV